ncbi:MAG TPA: WD40 repeat domain-containing protein, partial [Gemmataceae bacterium]|nr:WD40 repeat domain-containing protein [Gemmataceae bacterium]
YGLWTPLGFSADGKTLYVLDNEQLAAWDVAAGKPAREPFGYWMRLAVLLPDRKTLAVAEPGGLAMWSIPDEKRIGSVERPVAWIMDMVPSPSGRWLATGGSDGTILVWDVAALRDKP